MFKFIGNFLKWIGGIFRKAKNATKDFLPLVIDLVNNIKNFDAANPEIADMFTALIPGQFDDKAKELLRAELPRVLAVFVKAEEIAGLSDPDLIKYVASELQKVTDETKYAFNYTELAAMLVSALDDKKLTAIEWFSIVKFVYDNSK
jgi:hypothetical protein